MTDDRPRGDPLASATSAASTESTFTLIQLANAGDQAAVDRLIARHLTPLRRWARGRLPAWARDCADTDDLIQDTLLRTFKRLKDFEVRGPGALHAYLRQALVNRVRDEVRKKGRRPESTELEGLEVDGGRSPLEEAIGREAIERYEHALARLKPEEREAIIGRIEMGYSYDELAEALVRLVAEMNLPPAS